MGGSSDGLFNLGSLGPTRDLRALEIEDAAITAFQTQLAAILSQLLSPYNERDHALAAKRLAPIEAALRDTHARTFDLLFGGSVAKHTYVDGLSDIDCLLVMDGPELQDDAPADLLRKMADIIEGVADATIEVGRMAVTVRYPDGMELQLLPAVDIGGQMRVASNDGEVWSKIDPRAFYDALARRNAECGGKLIPTIKLAKAVLAALENNPGISGYHVESLAIEAFRGYAGVKTTAAMLPTFFERARSLALEPIQDSAGRSVQVDSDLGPANSSQRQDVSLVLGRIARQMRIASAAGSIERWQDFFGLDE
jgi:hypothetical protein